MLTQRVGLGRVAFEAHPRVYEVSLLLQLNILCLTRNDARPISSGTVGGN